MAKKQPTKRKAKPKVVRVKSALDCTFDELCRIKRDNFTVGNFWVLTDSYEVTLTEQRDGEQHTQQITIPIQTFRKLMKALMKPQEIKRGQK